MNNVVKWNKFSWKSVLFLGLIILGIFFLKLTSHRPKQYQNYARYGQSDNSIKSAKNDSDNQSNNFGVSNVDILVFLAFGLLLIIVPSKFNLSQISFTDKRKLLLRNIGFVFVGLAVIFFLVKITQR